ncbi:MAG TPA: hypothetical protein VD766_10830 [Solirubrobacterales bacterium]|nr:hypothetical protein [Solirubrobacterales bacterium]
MAALGLAIWAPSLLAGFKSGTYSGTTSQEDSAGNPKPLQLSVNKKKTKVSVVFFELEAPPCGGKGGLQWAGIEGKIKDNGKFKIKDDPYGYIKGRFHGSMADGTARYAYKPSGCDSGVITWASERSRTR